MKEKQEIQQDPEFIAMSTVYAALKNLESDVQTRVLNVVAAKLKLVLQTHTPGAGIGHHSASGSKDSEHVKDSEGVLQEKEEVTADLQGISPIAQKWLTRNGLNVKQLIAIFSIGGDEIDVIADAVPGSNKKEKMRSVFLLKGVAAYLGTGAARFTHEEMKEACLHYDAFDAANFAHNVKNLSSEVSGSKESGYTLNARGMAAAAKMVKEMIKQAKGETD